MKKLFWLKGLFRRAIGVKNTSAQCPWCGDFHWGEHNNIETLDSGKSFNGEVVFYWHQSIAKCIKCGHEYQYEDASY